MTHTCSPAVGFDTEDPPYGAYRAPYCRLSGPLPGAMNVPNGIGWEIWGMPFGN